MKRMIFCCLQLDFTQVAAHHLQPRLNLEEKLRSRIRSLFRVCTCSGGMMSNRHNGFMLIEVLIALSLFGLSAVYLVEGAFVASRTSVS